MTDATYAGLGAIIVRWARSVESLNGTHIHDPLFLAGAALNVAHFLAYTGAIAPRAWTAVQNVRGRAGSAGRPAS